MGSDEDDSSSTTKWVRHDHPVDNSGARGDRPQTCEVGVVTGTESSDLSSTTI